MCLSSKALRVMFSAQRCFSIIITPALFYSISVLVSNSAMNASDTFLASLTEYEKVQNNNYPKK